MSEERGGSEGRGGPVLSLVMRVNIYNASVAMSMLFLQVFLAHEARRALLLPPGARTSPAFGNLKTLEGIVSTFKTSRILARISTGVGPRHWQSLGRGRPGAGRAPPDPVTCLASIRPSLTRDSSDQRQGLVKGQARAGQGASILVINDILEQTIS